MLTKIKKPQIGLRASLIYLSVFFGLILTINSGLAWTALAKDARGFKELKEVHQAGYEEAKALSILFAQCQSSLFQHMASANTAWMELVAKHQDSLLTQLEQKASHPQALQINAKDRALLDTLLIKYKESYLRIRSFSAMNAKNDAQMFYLSDEMAVYAPLDSTLNAYASIAKQEFEKQGQSVEQGFRANQQLLLVVAIGSILILLVVNFMIGRGVFRKVGGEPEQIAQLARAISSGDLRACDHIHNARHGSILASIVEIAGSFAVTLRQTTELVQILRRESSSLATTAHEYESSLQNLSGHVHHTGAAIEEISSMVQLGVDHNKSSLERAIKASSEAQASYHFLELTIQSMTEIGTSATDIASISHKSNMLALNASIEAARAGQHGLGFEVVAREVRSLAEKTQQAAKKIDELRKSNSGHSHKLLDMIQAISNDFRQIQESIEQVFVASQEQSTGLEEINHSAQEISMSIGQQAEASQLISSTAQRLDILAQDLFEQLGKFKL